MALTRIQLSDMWQSCGINTDTFVRHVAVLWPYHGYSCQACGSPVALPQMQLSDTWQSCVLSMDAVVSYVADIYIKRSSCVKRSNDSIKVRL